jgi:hypothetical protein
MCVHCGRCSLWCSCLRFADSIFEEKGAARMRRSFVWIRRCGRHLQRLVQRFYLRVTFWMCQ